MFVETASRGGYILQRELREFEEGLAEYCGTGYAVGVGNATDGLELIVRLAGVGVDDEVLLASHTLVTVAGCNVSADLARGSAQPLLRRFPYRHKRKHVSHGQAAVHGRRCRSFRS